MAFFLKYLMEGGMFLYNQKSLHNLYLVMIGFEGHVKKSKVVMNFFKNNSDI